MKTLVFFLVAFFSLMINCFPSQGVSQEWLLALDSNSVKVEKIRHQDLDSIVGKGWDRVVYLTTTLLDTIEKTTTKICFEQAEIKSSFNVIVDPQISKSDLWGYLIDKDQPIQLERSVHYVSQLLWMYKDVTITESKIIPVKDSLKLNITRSTERKSAETLMFLTILLTVCLIAGFTLRRFVIAVSDKTITWIMIVVAVTPYFIGLALGFVPLFSNFIGFIGSVMLCFITVVIFYAAADITTNETGSVLNSMMLFGVLCIFVVAIYTITKSLSFSLTISGWFVFLYFLGYILAIVIKKMFPEKIEMIGEVKIFI